METARRYIGTPILQPPEGKLPTKAETLCYLFSYNNGNHRGFKMAKIHCGFDGNNSVICYKEGGCTSSDQLCMFRVLMKNWENFPCVTDNRIIEKIRAFKEKYSGVILRKRVDMAMTAELAETFNFASPNFEELINCDTALSPVDRQKKLETLLDFIGPNASRQAVIQKESEAVTRRRQELETAEALIDQDREARRDREKLRIEKERKRVEAARSDQAEAARSKSDRERRNVVNVVNNNSVSVDSEIEAFENSTRKERKRTENEEGIAVMLPNNLLELLTPLSVAENISERNLEMVVASVYRAAKVIQPQQFKVTETGVCLSRVYLSHSTAHRARRRQCTQISDSTMTEFCDFVHKNESWLGLHFDGKIMTADWDGRLQTVDFVASVLSGNNLTRPQIIGVTPLEVASAYNTAAASYEDMLRWDIADRVIYVVADTPSVNWGLWQGAVYEIAKFLGRQLIYIQDPHHTEELHPRAALMAVSKRPSTQPADILFKRFYEAIKVTSESHLWDTIVGDDMVYNYLRFQPYEGTPLADIALQVLRWANAVWLSPDFKNDVYQTAVKLLLVFGG